MALATLLPGRAGAYVQYRTSKDQPYRWCNASVSMTAYVGQAIDSLSSAEMLGAATASLATWNGANISCPSEGSSGFSTHLSESREAPPRAALDNRNAFIFRTSSWDWQGPPPEDGGIDPDMLYDPLALALTTLYVYSDGRILDADIEVNAVPGNYVWVWSDKPPIGTQDLQNTLTHEVGHVAGLDHSCWTGTGDRPVDDKHNPAPLCSDLPDGFVPSTMFPSASAGDVTKRVLGEDERRAMCEIYPRGAASTCPDDGCSCTVRRAGEGRSEPAWVAGLLVALFLVVRRR